MKELEMPVLPFPPNEKMRFFLYADSRAPDSRTDQGETQIFVLIGLFWCVCVFFILIFYLPVIAMSQITEDHV